MTASECPACGADAFVPSADGGECSRCGYVSGAAHRCPHCGAAARTERSGARFVCAVCGGPRIVAGYGGERAKAALLEERNELAIARAASFATVMQASIAGVVTLVGLAISSPLWKTLVFVLAAGAIFLALRSRLRAAAARKRAMAADERAWRAAAEEVAAASESGITAPELAKVLGIEEARADALLTSLAVHERIRVDVDESPEVRYSIARELDAEHDASATGAEPEAEPESKRQEHAR